MKTVYLTSGPRGAGKSTFTKKVASIRPEIELISRDEILIELFGSTSLSPYTGDYTIGIKVLFERIKTSLSYSKEKNLILDCWNGYPNERRTIIKEVIELGADRVVCWQFVVPVDICAQWFMLKPDSEGYSEFGVKNDHSLYYKMARDIEKDGFDKICHIDPLQLPELSSILI